MALKFADRIQESTTSTGTGPLLLLGETNQMKPFSSISGLVNGDTFWILTKTEDPLTGQFEICLGTWASGSITRSYPTGWSSSSGVAISWAAGLKTVSLVAPAVAQMFLDLLGNGIVPGTFQFGGGFLGHSRVITSGSSTTMASTDYEVIINKTISGAHTVILPAAPVLGQICRVSDGKGDLDIGLNTITINPASGFINGAASLTMESAWETTLFRAQSATLWNTIG